MVSRPLGNLTYSAWTSADGRSSGRAVGSSVTATSATAPRTLTASPPVRLTAASVPITHPPDPIARIVAHQQRAIRHHQQPDRAPPTGPVGQLPPGHEVHGRDRPAVLHVHPNDLRTR